MEFEIGWRDGHRLRVESFLNIFHNEPNQLEAISTFADSAYQSPWIFGIIALTEVWGIAMEKLKEQAGIHAAG